MPTTKNFCAMIMIGTNVKVKMCIVFSFVKCMKKCDKSNIYTCVVVLMNSNK